MGSEAHVIVVGDPRLLGMARARIEELERRWSRFVPTSEVSFLNSHRGAPYRVSAETFRLVNRGVTGWWETSGRFDPTILGDLIREGYDRPFQAVTIDPASGISVLRRNARGIRIDAEAQTVELPTDAGFDPGGVGKGLGADMVVEELLDAGAEGACVNLGGDLRVEGEGPEHGRWLISLDHPTASRPAALVALAAGGGAVAYTAAGAYASFEEEAKGTLEPGMLADLQVYRGDPLGDDQDVSWEELRPRAVLLGGARVYGSL